MRTRVVATVTTLNPLQSLIARRWRLQWVCTYCTHQRQDQRFSSTKSSPNQKPYYVTTPIFYVNAAPHVGHMYNMILADVLKRWQVLKGRKAMLLTGTDEHGMKIQQAAAKAGVEPKLFCDRGAELFQDLAESMEMSNDIFIRTTDEHHKEGVEYAWQMLLNEGYIYESKHEGWYSVSDETFYPQAQVQLIVDPPTGRKIMSSIETGKEVEWTSERNYHFRLSAFKDQLLEFYARNPDYIVPKMRMDDVVAQVSSGLADLSISRPSERLSWGVRVPNDPSQTVYVWLDALLNYATAVGYPFTPGTEQANGWPPDVQVIGKDIIRFHCIYWPAFMMALGLPIHKQVLTHAHWTMNKKKMAKSSGNGVSPFFALERFGLEPLRWYLIHDGGINDDADYDNSFVVQKYRKHLKGGLGNLLGRITRGRDWKVASAVRACQPGTQDAPPQGSHDQAKSLHTLLRTIPSEVDAHMTALYPNRALQTAMQLVHETNAFLQQTEPWTVARHLRLDQVVSPEQRVAMQQEIDRHIYLSAEALRLLGIILQPFMPNSATKLLDILGVARGRRTWTWCRVGADDSYGTPLIEISSGQDSMLFPPLVAED